MSVINNIAHSLRSEEGQGYATDYTNMSVEDKSGLLEDYLTSVCNSLAEVHKLVDEKPVDVEYLLSVVGSYLIGIEEGGLDPLTTEPPSYLFETSLYPSLDGVGTTIEAEEIKEEDEDGTQDTSDDEGYDTQDPTD